MARRRKARDIWQKRKGKMCGGRVQGEGISGASLGVKRRRLLLCPCCCEAGEDSVCGLPPSMKSEPYFYHRRSLSSLRTPITPPRDIPPSPSLPSPLTGLLTPDSHSRFIVPGLCIHFRPPQTYLLCLRASHAAPDTFPAADSPTS